MIFIYTQFLAKTNRGFAPSTGRNDMKTKQEIEKQLAEETAKEEILSTDEKASDLEIESQLATVDTLRWVLGFCG